MSDDTRYADSIRECTTRLNDAIVAAAKDGLRVEVSITEPYGFLGYDGHIPPRVEVQVWRRA